jgi:hypothetical protein
MDPTPPPPGKPRVESPRPAVVNPNLYCPRCGGLLKFPETIGACMVCGYSRVKPTGGPVSQQALTPSLRPGSRSETLETFRWLLKLPAWFWVLLLGCVVIIGGGIFANWWLPVPSTSPERVPRLTTRTIISTITLAIAIPGILITQVWVLFSAAAKDARLEFLDAMNPIRAWSLAIGRLPDTRHPLCSACWCWSAVLTAFLAVGGMDYWMPSKHKPFKTKAKEFVKAVASLRFDEEADDDEDDSEPPPPLPAQVDPDSRPTLTCTIIGYLTNPEEGGLNGILLAIRKDEKLKYAGIVEAGLRGKRAERIRDQLSRFVTSKPQLEGVEVEGAIWVKPGLTCTIHQAGVAATGLLLEPSFGELIAKRKR